jgi:toxin ParE1/3/4
VSERRWSVRLTATAEADFEQIVQWTIDQFGERQALVYAETLSLALEALGEGPEVIGAKARDEILKGLFSLHVARKGRKGRHFVMFRIAERGAGHVIEVLRLLHDSMDLPRHLESSREER